MALWFRPWSRTAGPKASQAARRDGPPPTRLRRPATTRSDEPTAAGYYPLFEGCQTMSCGTTIHGMHTRKWLPALVVRRSSPLAAAAKGVTLRLLDLSIDTSTATGRMLLTMIGAIAQFERELMLERQRKGIAKAKAAGKYKGRAPTARAKIDQIRALRSQGVGATEIARRLGIGRASVYRLCR